MLSVVTRRSVCSVQSCLLHLTVTLVLLSVATADDVEVSVRKARSAAEQIQPVDCVLAEWSSWSRCDTCQKKRYRFAKLLTPAQFGGQLCTSFGREEEDCVVSERYKCNNVPECEGFLCAETGRCIHRTLQCSGEDDCGDMSDEVGCPRRSKPCREEVEEYWGIENLAKGINVLNSNLEGVVLDNRYYGGSCLPHYIENDRFRKPYNLQQYTMQTRGSLDFTTQTFESYSDFQSHRMHEVKTETSFGIGFAIPGIFEFGFNFNDARRTKSEKKLRRASGKRTKFVRSKSVLEMAQYVLRSDNLVLHPEFLKRLRSLPQSYTYGEYRQIYRDYGTHYATEATLGGEFEHILILNNDTSRKTDYTLDDYSRCTNAGLKLGANIKGVYVSGGISGGDCYELLNEKGGDSASDSLVQDFTAVVRGGSSESIAALLAEKLPTPELMQLWGEGVRFNPDFLHRTTWPLYELVTERDFTQHNTLKRNLKKAMSEYLAEADSCQCAPCRNNGVAVLKGTGRCECVCPNGYSGRACEITKRKKAIAIDGNWSCWSPWSSCSGRRMSRSRQCNNPAPSADGTPCTGLQQDSTEC